MDQLQIAAGWTPRRLEGVRNELRSRRQYGCLVPRWDAYQHEYVIPRDERLAWASGFTGSWGLALITLDAALLFVDGRYTVQAREQTSSEHFQIRHLRNEPVEEWIRAHAVPAQVYAYDPAIVTPALFDALAEAAAQAGARLEPETPTALDAAWIDRPAPELTPIVPFPVARAGESSQDKRQRLAQSLGQSRLNLLVETQPDNIAWLLNLRGSDVAYTPIPHARALISDTGNVDLCVDQRKLTHDRGHYELHGVALHEPDRFFDVLRQRVKSGDRVGIDPNFAPVGAVAMTHAAGGNPVLGADPLTRLKAIKNATELGGLRAASRRDSVAWIRFLMWLEEEVPRRAAAGRPVTELAAEEKILEYRRTLPHFVYPSFRTISASDASAAMCHYAAPASGGRHIQPDSIYLIDSGGQYQDGTTDTTRTVCLGTAPAEVRRNYTLVLKGHARLASARFPVGTRGHQIDAFAREPLWRYGLDYDHGTGHGVGHFLSVHEHPQRLMKDASPAGFQAGMTLTNEPGYYRAGEYGIRIENLCEIVQSGEGFLKLREMTLVPISSRLIDPALLEPLERSWLNAYHTRVREEMSALFEDRRTRVWLAHATAPL